MADQNFDVKGFIQKSRAQDIPDDVTYKYLQGKGLVSGGTPGVSQATPDTTPPAPKQGLLSSIAGGVSNLAKSIVKPVVQTVAAPFQAIKSTADYIKDPLKESKTDFTLPWLGKIEAPTSVKQQVGRSLETVGVGLGPVAGGAAFGAGNALDENKSLGQAALQAAVGAASGKVLEYGSDVVGKGLQKLGTMTSDGIAKTIEKSTLPLTDVQKGKMSTALNRATDFLMNYGVKGSNVERFDKVKGIGDTFETQLQDFLDKNNTKVAPVSKGKLISDLTKLKGNLMKDSADAPTIEKQINAAIENLSSQYRNEKIPIARLNVLKRSTFDNAYNGAGDKVLDFVEHDIGDVYKTAIERATEGLKIEGPNGVKMPIEDFNKEYGDLLNAKKILKVVTNNGVTEKPLMGKTASKLFPRLLGSLIGGTVGFKTGGEKGAIEGAIGGGLASSYLPALLEVVGGANSRTQLVAALQYLSEHADNSMLGKATDAIQPALEKAGGVIKNVPKALKDLPREPIPGTGEIPGFKATAQSAKDFVKSPTVGMSIKDVGNRFEQQYNDALYTLKQQQNMLSAAKKEGNATEIKRLERQVKDAELVVKQTKSFLRKGPTK